MGRKKAKGVDASNPVDLLLTFHECPGDTLVATGAVESLCRQYPGQYRIAVEGTATAHIFENNPRTFKKEDLHEGYKTIGMKNTLINSAHIPHHFMMNYVHVLAEELGVPLDLQVTSPVIYLSHFEKTHFTCWDGDKVWAKEMDGVNKYWLVNSGYKNCYTTKNYGQHNYQAIVDSMPEIKFVQVGEPHHNHKPLNGAINLLGKTDCRQLLRLAYHSEGCLTGVSFLHHIAAAFTKPCVTLASGMENKSWEAYSSGTYMSKAQCFTCSNKGRGCWKSRVVPLNDGDVKDNSLCELPVVTDGNAVPACLDAISPEEVAAAIRSYYVGGAISS